MREFFPDLSLGSVVVVEEANWPSFLAPTVNLALEFRDAGAIALPSRIYWRGEFDQHSCGDLATLMHELMHFRQLKRMGRLAFACEYGMESVRGYAANRFEREARRFVNENRWRLEQHCAALPKTQPTSRIGRRDDSWWWVLAG
jgi:hypothetical protein